MKKVIVARQFRDKIDHKTIYNPGTVIENFDEDRIQNLLERGLVKLQSDQPATGLVIDLSKGVKDIAAAVAGCTDPELLQSVLEAENKSAKPRKGVTEAIESRLVELANNPQ